MSVAGEDPVACDLTRGIAVGVVIGKDQRALKSLFLTLLGYLRHQLAELPKDAISRLTSSAVVGGQIVLLASRLRLRGSSGLRPECPRPSPEMAL